MRKSYFRPEIDTLAGYTPGEQPKISDLIKLNTNENPFPPSPRVGEALAGFDYTSLKLYPSPEADALRADIAAANHVEVKNVIVGNGSDDLLTMIFRAFTDLRRPLATPVPSYSLYPVLAAMQGAPVIEVPLSGRDFALPDDFSARVAGANLLTFARPNAPTGTSCSRDELRAICRDFDGVVMIDEAYADFAADNCMDFATEFDNVIVTRTFSKSYSLAGLRLGYAVAHPTLIAGMMKLKDSYNVDRLAQTLGRAAFSDGAYLRENCAKICELRAYLCRELELIGFEIPQSHSNFLFASPPDGDGERCFKLLRENAIIVRYFPGEATGRYVRISVGTREQLEKLLAVLREAYR